MNQRRRFRILETLGKGGFGTVYRAEMSDAGGFAKQVALKVMHYEGAQSDDIARRLRDEARVLGLIRHRAVVGVNSLVPLEQGWGVVMEYVDGVDLSTAIKAGALPVGVCLDIVEEMAAALESAYNGVNHDTKEPLRLVHRDIKPSNVRITRQGEVKLLDFGVAQADFSARESEDSTEFVMGSTRYMAPERRRGVESHEGDVYALGLVLGNMLTRKRFPEPPPRREDHAKFLGVVSETVHKVLAASEDEQIVAAASELKLLLLEMLAFESADRPNAGAIERRCRRIRARLPPPHQRDWADRNVPRLILKEAEQRKQDLGHEAETGRVLTELGGDERRAFISDERSLPPWGSASRSGSTPAATPAQPQVPRPVVTSRLRQGLLLLVGAVLGAGLTLLAQLALGQAG